MSNSLPNALRRSHQNARFPACLRVLVVQFVIVAWVVPPAFAHASLVSAAPAPGEVVPPALAEIYLTFDENLGLKSTLEVFTTSFQTVPVVVPQVEGNVIRAALATPLAPGAYTVQWTAVSADRDSIQGSYQFGVSQSA